MCVFAVCGVCCEVLSCFWWVGCGLYFPVSMASRRELWYQGHRGIHNVNSAGTSVYGCFCINCGILVWIRSGVICEVLLYSPCYVELFEVLWY